MVATSAQESPPGVPPSGPEASIFPPPLPARPPLKASDAPLVWIDCEMTGLDVFHDTIIEIAVIITDGELRPFDQGLAYTILTDKAQLDAMDTWCQTTHGETAQEGILKYIQDRVEEPRTAPLAGNSVHMDKFFMMRLFPEVVSYLHYRIVDVSSIYELTRRWHPKKLAAFDESRSKRGIHRALPDIQDSISQLAWYRQNIVTGNGQGLDHALPA